MANGNESEEELRLRVVYEASQVVRDAIADIRALKEATGSLNEEQQKTLEKLEYQKTLLDGAGSGLDHYTELVNEEVNAQKYYHQVLDETTESLRAQAEAQQALDDVVARNQLTIQTSTADFSKLGGSIMAAERAGQALTTGTGLARVGGMLEKITVAVGGPAGLGMALGALAMGLEGMLPKIEAWIDKWEKGAKTVDEVKKALDLLDKAQETSDKERAVRRVDRQIRKLEDKEDDQGYLAEDEREKLTRLQADSMRAHQELAAEKKIAGLGETGKGTKARGAAVRESFAEAGISGEGVATLLASKLGVSYQEGVEIVAGALGGGQAEIGKIAGAEARFGEAYGRLSPEAKEAAKRQKKQDELSKHLTEQGRHAEEKMNREREHEHDKDSAEGTRLGIQYGEEAIREENREQTKAARDQTKAARERKRLDDKTARENTMAHRMHAAVQQQHEQVAGFVGQANEAYGFARTPGQLEEVTRGAVSNVNMGMDLASAVQMAVAATEAKIQRDFQRSMQRQFSGGEMRGQ